MNEQALTLAGRTIAVPETRELDVFAGLLERRGAAVIRCPLVAILDAPDPAPVLAWVEQFSNGECHDLILLTGEGLRRILSCIDRNAPHLREPFVARLATVRKITRGPKPARALRELGLAPDLAADVPTTEGIIAMLSKHELHGRCIAVQLYGSDPNTRLINFLEQAGARVLCVAPYIYADSSADESLRDLARQLLAGKVDAIAFTSMQQVTRLFDVLGVDDASAALKKTLIAAVGPVVADALRQRGVQVSLMPEDAYFLKPLTRALEEAFAPSR
jgi:uroporphyrinogen-III synthase